MNRQRPIPVLLSLLLIASMLAPGAAQADVLRASPARSGVAAESQASPAIAAQAAAAAAAPASAPAATARSLSPAAAYTALLSGSAAPAAASSGSECVPVVFVPGITGSPNIPPFDSPEQPLFSQLQANGYKEGETLFRFSYNWLGSNESSAASLASYIDNIKRTIENRTGKRPQYVSIIAHSMGGFVTRIYLSGHQSEVDQAFSVGSPYAGSAEMIARGTRWSAGLTGPSQLLPTWQAVFDQNGNPVANNAGYGYNLWVQGVVWPAPQPKIQFYSTQFPTSHTVTRTAYTVFYPDFGPVTEYSWQRRSYLPGDQTVDQMSAVTSVGSTRIVGGSHAGDIGIGSGRGAGSIVESAAPQLISELKSSTKGGPENCYPYKLEITVNPQTATIPACVPFNYQVKVLNKDTGQPVQQLQQDETLEIKITGSAFDRDTNQNTTQPTYSGSTPAVKRPGSVRVEAKVTYLMVIPSPFFPTTYTETRARDFKTASATLGQPPTRRDRCGRLETATFDEASCSWKWPPSNTPCLPDDNRSVAGPSVLQAAAFVAPAAQVAAATTGDGGGIAVLANGFEEALLDMLGSLSLRADRVAADFSPEIASQYRVLIIPSGGLSGFAQSQAMRDRLAQFTNNGGTIVAFAQQYGSEYALLPGGALEAYGYDEDINCQANSTRIATFGPMLISQPDELLSLNVDGFFLRWPANAEVLLTRTANGMPNMVAYQAGTGWVLATTAYADMARAQGQGTADETRLVRDLMTWALDPSLQIDRYGPTDNVSIPLHATNNTITPTTSIDFTIVNQEGNWVYTSEALPLALAPGQTRTVTATVPMPAILGPSGGEFGVWHVGVGLIDAAGVAVQKQSEVYSFASSRFTQMESGLGYAGQPYALSVTSESEEYPYNSPATFTYNVFNHSDQEQTFRVDWYMIHHSWYNVPGYQGSGTVTVPAHSFGAVSGLLDRVVDLDRVRATLYLNGNRVFYAERGFWVVPARLNQTIRSDKTSYNWGEQPVVTISTTNASAVSTPVSAAFAALRPGGTSVLTDTRSFTLPGNGSHSYNLTLPPLTVPGQYNLSVEDAVYGRSAYRSAASFSLAPLQARVTPDLPASLGSNAAINATVANLGQGVLPASTLQVSLTSPSGATLWSDQAALPAMNPGEQRPLAFTLALPSPVTPGDYVLHYAVESPAGTLSPGRVTLPAKLALETSLDRPSYRIRETLHLSATLRNVGRWEMAPSLTVSGGTFGLNDAQSPVLAAGAAQTYTYQAIVPATLNAGAYPIDLGYSVGGVAVESRNQTVIVPDAQIRPELALKSFAAGDTIRVTLANPGGVDAPTSSTLKLIDGQGQAIATTSPAPTVLAGTIAEINFVIPAGAADGEYWLALEGRNTATGAPFDLYESVRVAGVTAGLHVETLQPAFFKDEMISMWATGSVLTGTLSGGTLNLRICSPTEVSLIDVPPVAAPARAAALSPEAATAEPTPDLSDPDIPGRAPVEPAAGPEENAASAAAPELSAAPMAAAPLAASDAPYKSYLYTVGNVIFFSYANGSDLALYSSTGQLVWQGTLNAGQHQIVYVATGTYLATGSQKFAILGGDPVSNGVAGYYAADQNGFGVSTELYTWTQYPYFYPNERFIVTAYQDATQVTVSDATTGQVYWSGTLNNGQRWQTNTLYQRWLHITANKGVSAYTYYDQGSLVPASDGRWSGTFFYTYAGMVGYWPNDVNMMAFQDNTQVTIKNTDTGQIYWSGTLNSGQIHTETFGGYTGRGEAYLTVSSDKTIAVTVAPFTSYTSSYHMGFYAPDASGSRIGTDIIAPLLSGGTLQVFAYRNGTTIDLYDSRTNQKVNTITLDAGQSSNISQSYGLWRLRSDKPISAWAGWGQWSAEFAPVLFGSIVIKPPYQPGCGYVLWEKNVPVSTNTTFDLTDAAGPLGVVGREMLDGRLFAATGQLLARDRWPFYLFDRSTALTLETGKTVYRPGETIQASGMVTNTSAIAANLTLALTEGANTLLSQALTLAPGEGAPYNATLTATQNVTLTATADQATASVRLEVADPQIAAQLIAPAVAGRQPFSVTLVLTNTGVLPAALNTQVAGQAQLPFGMQPGEVRQIAVTTSIAQDTTITAEVSGDAQVSLSQLVLQGEITGLTLSAPPDPLFAGPIPVSYAVPNTGLLPATAPLIITVDGAEALTQSVATLPGNSTGGVLYLNLAAGVHTVLGSTPYAQASLTLTVYPRDEQRVTIDEVLAPAQLIGRSPVTVTLTNRGSAPVAGDLTIHVPFDRDAAPFALAPGGSAPVVLHIDGGNATAAGDYTLKAQALSNGQVLDEATRPVAVPATRWQVEMPTFVLVPGTPATLPFTVLNAGGIGGAFVHVLELDGLFDDRRTGWLAPGASMGLTYTFFVPADLEARQGTGRYLINGEIHPFAYTIAGYQLGMTGALSPAVANEGQQVAATIQIADTSGSGRTIPLVVRLAGVGDQQAQAVDLVNSAQVSFAITAPGQDALLSYGIYHPDGRSLLLDTMRLYVIGAANGLRPLGVYPDRDRYQPGETVQLTASSGVAGTIILSFLGSTSTLDLLPNTAQTTAIVLPGDLPAGTYDVAYHFTSVDGRVVDGKASFEVGGDRAAIGQIQLERQGTACTGEAAATVKLEALRAMTGVTLRWYVTAPDGQQVSAAGSRVVDLPAGASWWSLPAVAYASGQSGTHYLNLEVEQASRQLSSGRESFDLGEARLLGVSAEQPYFRAGTPAGANVSLQNSGTAPQALSVSVDGQVVSQPAITQQGYVNLLIDLGGPAAGKHTVTANLAGADGCSGAASTQITIVPPPAVEIVASTPDGLSGWYVTAPTVYLRYSDPVATELTGYYRWNNGPEHVDTGIALPLPGEGQHVVAGRAVANDGSASGIATQTLPIDLTPPQVSATVAGEQPKTVTLQASDATSLVARIEYQVNAGTWQAYVTPLTFALAPGETVTVGYRARDVAGNWSATASITLTGSATACELYPIAVYQGTVAGVPVGGQLPDIYNGTQPGNFGWLTWAGSPSDVVLARSLTPPGDSNTYVNPHNPADHNVSVGDFVLGAPGVGNSSPVRGALDTLIGRSIVIPVWDTTSGQGSGTEYRVSGFARVKLTGYSLAGQNRISAMYDGQAACGQ